MVKPINKLTKIRLLIVKSYVFSYILTFSRFTDPSSRHYLTVDAGAGPVGYSETRVEPFHCLSA